MRGRDKTDNQRQSMAPISGDIVDVSSYLVQSTVE